MNKSYHHPHGCRCRDMGLPSKVGRKRGYCTKNAFSCSSLPCRGIRLGTSVHKIRESRQYNRPHLPSCLHEKAYRPGNSRTGKPILNEYSYTSLINHVEKEHILLIHGRKRAGNAGQSHLINPIQNKLKIGVVPSGFVPLGMDADARRFLLAQEIQTDVPEHGQIFVGLTLTDA